MYKRQTYNHAISVNEEKNAIQTVAEKAKKAGKKVGVTTSVSVDPVSYTHLLIREFIVITGCIREITSLMTG